MYSDNEFDNKSNKYSIDLASKDNNNYNKSSTCLYSKENTKQNSNNINNIDC